MFWRPLLLLQNYRRIIKNEGVLIVDVPNDFSVVQKHLFENNYIDEPYWIAIPDHISYFNHNGIAFARKFYGMVV